MDNDVAVMPDVHDTGMKIERAREVYAEHLSIEEKPSKVEVYSWYLYGLCSYFIQTVLVPIVFPLLISQIFKRVPPPTQGWYRSFRGLACDKNEMTLYRSITYQSINVGQWTFSSLEWVSASWVIGLILAAPFLGFASFYLDHSRSQQIIAGAATVIGVVFCLPAGSFRLTWIFPPYIAAIVAAHTIATAAHTRHLGLMIRGFTGPTLNRDQFHLRRAASTWLSLIATAVGSLGCAAFSSFTSHMVNEKFVGLWVVSIFSGIMWLVGILHVGIAQRSGLPSTSTPISHFFSTLAFPQAVGGLVSVFLGSFTAMCIFTGGVLFVMGQLCLKPVALLYLLLTYFLFPIVSLPLMHPLQHVLRTSAVKMKILGFALSMLTSGMGFYFREKTWAKEHVLLFAAIQGTSAGTLHAFGRVLILDSAPCGKEGAFAAWHSWVGGIGACAGFAAASAVPGKIGTSFGVAFLGAALGAIVLVYGNVSDYGGALRAGHVKGDGAGRGLPEHAFDDEVIVKEQSAAP
ncbi:hypothetical protein EUGRSUZ_D02621 [Eucalyptus grandis]|uniref:Uncharacterized protein n=2 Tax=Eucalyptus grandis TaxID=71139 RepID=A0ACC3L8H0_EUCGR|nr:hypothetical protein EUGRSUZ_D02621 [Eucalyptus grandis]